MKGSATDYFNIYSAGRNHYEQAKLHDETDQNVLIKTFD
jgi:hypothetical protein